MPEDELEDKACSIIAPSWTNEGTERLVPSSFGVGDKPSQDVNIQSTLPFGKERHTSILDLREIVLRPVPRLWV